MPLIIGTVSGSIAEEGGITRGDELIAVNGEVICDAFDYRFHTSSSELEMLLRNADGDEWILEVEKPEDEDPGIIFENDLLDEPRSCANRCVFCFIDQLPRGMRAPLYFKDDDVRLTFTNGNYVTLTNADEDDLKRIVRYGLSPVNVSAHTTDAALRAAMLGWRGEASGRYDVLPKIRYLTESGITVNAQIVLCRNYNDGAALDATLRDLGALNNRLLSVSVVPVGLSRYREGLTPLDGYDKKSAESVLAQLAPWQNEFMKKRGSRTVFAADEFYILSGKRLPGSAFYENYPQLENGVGMIALFLKQFREGIYYLKRGNKLEYYRTRAADMPVTYIFTGLAAFETLLYCARALMDVLPKLNVEVVPVENAFFGKKITVSGLLTGQDILNQAEKMIFLENSRIFISKTMLKYNTELFLDDFTLEKLRKKLKMGIIAVENHGRAFIRALLRS